MKRFSLVLFSILSLIFFAMTPFSSVKSLAQTPGIGRVLKDGVIIYLNPTLQDNDALFTLTKSYYVEIIDVNTTDDYYIVDYQKSENGYQGLIGYVKKTDITIWAAATVPYYPDISATAINNTFIYQEADASSQGKAVIKNQSVKLYGSFYNEDEGVLYYFANFINNLGYIPAQMLNFTQPALHSDPMPTPTPTPTPVPTVKPPTNSADDLPPISGNKDSLLQIILISAICIPALIIVYLMFRPSKKIKRNYKKYYDDDENDDE